MGRAQGSRQATTRFDVVVGAGRGRSRAWTPQAQRELDRLIASGPLPAAMMALFDAPDVEAVLPSRRELANRVGRVARRLYIEEVREVLGRAGLYASSCQTVVAGSDYALHVVPGSWGSGDRPAGLCGRVIERPVATARGAYHANPDDHCRECAQRSHGMDLPELTETYEHSGMGAAGDDSWENAMSDTLDEIVEQSLRSANVPEALRAAYAAAGQALPGALAAALTARRRELWTHLLTDEQRRELSARRRRNPQATGHPSESWADIDLRDIAAVLLPARERPAEMSAVRERAGNAAGAAARLAHKRLAAAF